MNPSTPTDCQPVFLGGNVLKLTGGRRAWHHHLGHCWHARFSNQQRFLSSIELWFFLLAYHKWFVCAASFLPIALFRPCRCLLDCLSDLWLSYISNRQSCAKTGWFLHSVFGCGHNYIWALLAVFTLWQGKLIRDVMNTFHWGLLASTHQHLCANLKW